MRLIGIDPGLRHTGWGLIDVDGVRLRFLACGTVDSDDGAPLPARLVMLYDGLATVLRDARPASAAVEETVVNRNAGSSLKLGQARGVVLLAAAHAGVPVEEYGAKRIKRAVTGTGAADKQQVAAMVRILLGHAAVGGADATDALAAAICHAHHLGTAQRLAAATGATGA
jgi:crossover junction endodeoxyribonuclease RuvC